jgi:hypothetical protein
MVNVASLLHEVRQLLDSCLGRYNLIGLGTGRGVPPPPKKNQKILVPCTKLDSSFSDNLHFH